MVGYEIFDSSIIELSCVCGCDTQYLFYIVPGFSMLNKITSEGISLPPITNFTMCLEI